MPVETQATTPVLLWLCIPWANIETLALAKCHLHFFVWMYPYFRQVFHLAELQHFSMASVTIILAPDLAQSLLAFEVPTTSEGSQYTYMQGQWKFPNWAHLESKPLTCFIGTFLKQNIVNLWNSLPLEVVEAESTATWKKELDKFMHNTSIND